MNIVSVPAQLSESDAEQRRLIIKALERLRREYATVAEPYVTALVDINNRNPPRVVLVPEEGDPVPEYVRTLLTEEDAWEEGDV